METWVSSHMAQNEPQRLLLFFLQRGGLDIRDGLCRLRYGEHQALEGYLVRCLGDWTS